MHQKDSRWKPNANRTSAMTGFFSSSPSLVGALSPNSSCFPTSFEKDGSPIALSARGVLSRGSLECYWNVGEGKRSDGKKRGNTTVPSEWKTADAVVEAAKKLLDSILQRLRRRRRRRRRKSESSMRERFLQTFNDNSAADA